ncbi:MarR family winged helix-turn-helix transcriptional regulator [Nocardioides aequoreus]|uniref:MarR family winged helix-turn-helix transcriptional regulator n=1 Tax=Nocardioides aequoreus TaxID=397278 RepID=UPI000689E060|nr:MarR family winged helix-turn-helix transcriptional regulator [Nocardioides aequoreus]
MTESTAGSASGSPADGGPVLLAELAVLPGHLLWRAAARVTATAATELPDEVDVHAYAVLVALKGGAVRSQQDLADGIAVSRTTMTKVARDLVRAGLVARVRNPEDRRSYALSRTPAGTRAEATWRAHVLRVQRAVAPGLSVPERADLADLLRRVVEPRLSADIPAELWSALGFLVVKAHAVAHRDVLAALEPWGLEPRHLGSSTVLRALGPVPQVALARALGVTPASTVQIVDELERLALVERRRSTTDRRTQLLHLTPGSAAVLPEAGRAAGRAMDDVLGVLDASERSRLVALLQRFVTSATS